MFTFPCMFNSITMWVLRSWNVYFYLCVWRGTLSIERSCSTVVTCFHSFFWDLLLSWVATKTSFHSSFQSSGFLSFFQSRIAKMVSNQDLQSRVKEIFNFFPLWLTNSSTDDFAFLFQQKGCLISIGFQFYDSFLLPTANFPIF